jgi:hypothetical protein
LLIHFISTIGGISGVLIGITVSQDTRDGYW